MVWDVSTPRQEVVVGGPTLALFSSSKQLKTGKQKLWLWHTRQADGSVPTTTPAKVPKHERGEVERLEKLMNKFERGLVAHIDWLDRLTFNAIEDIKEGESKRKGSTQLHPAVYLPLVEKVVLEHQPEHQGLVLEAHMGTKPWCSRWCSRTTILVVKTSCGFNDETMGIEIADALELLSPVFESEEVRGHAVTVLEGAEDVELQCYLLELVQALRFERSDKSRLSYFLVKRATQKFELARFLRWYAMVELHDPAYAKDFIQYMKSWKIL